MNVTKPLIGSKLSKQMQPQKMRTGIQRPKKGQCKTSPHSTGKEHCKLQTLKAARISGLWPKGQKNASVNRTAFNWTRTLETLLTLIVNSPKNMPRQRMRNGAPGKM